MIYLKNTSSSNETMPFYVVSMGGMKSSICDNLPRAIICAAVV